MIPLCHATTKKGMKTYSKFQWTNKKKTIWFLILTKVEAVKLSVNIICIPMTSLSVDYQITFQLLIMSHTDYMQNKENGSFSILKFKQEDKWLNELQKMSIKTKKKNRKATLSFFKVQGRMKQFIETQNSEFLGVFK